MNIGFDIGGSHIASGIVNEKGQLIGKESEDIDISKFKTETEIEDFIIEIIDRKINYLLVRYNYHISDINKIGIAIPGNVNNNIIQNVVNLHIKKFDIAQRLSNIYNKEIKVKNDAKCAGIAEKKFGNLKEYNDAVFLCMGTGVGCAVFMQNVLLEPKQATGFELGHMVIEKNGIECNCKNKGCFETYASMKRFKKNAIARLNLPLSIEAGQVQYYIRENFYTNSEVKKFVNEYIDNVAIGITNIINIFEPEAIAFGGSFSYYSDIFLPLLETKIEKIKFNKETKTKLLVAKLKNDAGIIGATLI